MLLDWAEANRAVPYTVHIVGESWSGRAYELREALQQCAIPHHFCLADSAEGSALVAAAGKGVELPIMVFPTGQVLVNPTNAEIAVANEQLIFLDDEAEDARLRAVTALAAEKSAAASRSAREEAERRAAIEAAAASEAAKRSESQAAEQASLAANSAARADLIARLNRVLPTRETERGIVAEIAGVQFAIGKATLNDDARQALARFAGIVGVYPSMKFRVEGHTDITGSAEFNRDLSFKRASTVRDFLITQGVSNSSIDVEGLGPDRPVASNDTTEGRARNRRVEIILSGDPVAAP